MHSKIRDLRVPFKLSFFGGDASETRKREREKRGISLFHRLPWSIFNIYRKRVRMNRCHVRKSFVNKATTLSAMVRVFFFLEALNFISSLPSFINLQDRNIFGTILFSIGESEWNFEIYRDLVFYYEINKRGKKLYFLNVFVFEKFKNLNLKRIRENFVFDED